MMTTTTIIKLFVLRGKEGKGLIVQALSNKKKEREQINLLFFIVHHMAMEKKYSRPMT